VRPFTLKQLTSFLDVLQVHFYGSHTFTLIFYDLCRSNGQRSPQTVWLGSSTRTTVAARSRQISVWLPPFYRLVSKACSITVNLVRQLSNSPPLHPS